MSWLEFSQRVFRSINKSEGRGFVSTEFGSETEDDDLLERSIELFGDQLLEVFLGDDSGFLMDDIDNELGSVKELIFDELSCSDWECLGHLYGLYFLVFLRL